MCNPNAAINTTFPLQASSVISDGVLPSFVSFFSLWSEEKKMCIVATTGMMLVKNYTICRK